MEEDFAKEASRKGRPKGSKNKPKRGRPKKAPEKRPVGRPKKDSEPSSKSGDIERYTQSKSIVKTEDSMLDSMLDDNKFLEKGYNVSQNRVVNENPIDESYFYRGSKNVPIAGAEYEFTADMVLDLQRCKKDIIYFAENFFYIVTLDNGKQKIELYPAQKRALLSLVNNRFTALMQSRQSGKSTILTIFVLWMACFHDDHRAAIVANKETTAINIFKRIRMAYEQLPNYIKPGVKEYGKTGMTLGNDSSVIVSTTTATSIRGDTLNALAIDEAAFIEPHLLEEFWSSVIPSISSGKKSKILMVSTPNGIGNKFYEIFSGAEKGTMKGWKSERIDWWEIPGRDEDWKNDMIAALGGSEEKFNQEFGNQFLDDSSSAVGSSVIERFKREKKEAIWTSDDQEYIVFEYPNQNNLYVIGVDVGEGIGRAASVAQVLDVTNLQDIKQVAVYGSTTIEPYHFANKLNLIGSSWGFPPMLIERNNCGAQVIDALYYKHQYEKLVSYAKISESEKYNRTRNMGVLSHTNIKFDGIQNMRYWVNHLECVNINDPTTISEFETFVRQPNGIFKKRSDSFFDDRIMALVWSLFILEPEICEQYFTIAEFDTQNKPMRITSNGYWETLPENYELKSLDINSPQFIANPNPNAVDSIPYETPFKLDFTPEERAKYDKYQYDDMDMDSLMGLGFTPFLPPQ